MAGRGPLATARANLSELSSYGVNGKPYFISPGSSCPTQWSEAWSADATKHPTEAAQGRKGSLQLVVS